MPLNIYKNSNFTLTTTTTTDQTSQQSKSSEFFLTNYSRSITLIDLILFDYDHIQFAYSELAASAFYLSLCQTTRERRIRGSQQKQQDNTQHSTLTCPFAAYLVEKCTGLRMDELERCVNWMRPHADVVHEQISMSTNDKSLPVYPDEDPDNMHNIQVQHNYRIWLVSKYFENFLKIFF